MDIRKDLYAYIVLSRGSTMFPGFAERMQKEMVAMAPPAATVEILLNARALLGSLLNNINFGNMCISKQDYAAFGPSIV